MLLKMFIAVIYIAHLKFQSIFTKNILPTFHDNLGKQVIIMM